MTPNQPPLATEGLTRSFGGEAAVDSLDLQVEVGEIHAVVGLNGAGKTTLMRLLLGMLRPDSGRAMVMGVDAGQAQPALWRRVGHLVETPLAYPELTVTDNIAAAALLHGVERSLVRDVVESSIDRFELSHWSEKKARHLSLGNRHRLGLASTLAHEPQILILDEPTNSLDPAGIVLVRDELSTARDRGAAILVSSHHLDELARVADRITVLHRGQRVGSLDPFEADLERRFFDLVYEADLAWRGAV